MFFQSYNVKCTATFFFGSQCMLSSSSSKHHCDHSRHISWAALTLLEWLDIVGGQHAIDASAFHASIHPAIIDHLRLNDVISLSKTYLVTVSSLIVIYCHVHLSITYTLMCTLRDNRGQSLSITYTLTCTIRDNSGQSLVVIHRHVHLSITYTLTCTLRDNRGQSLVTVIHRHVHLSHPTRDRSYAVFIVTICILWVHDPKKTENKAKIEQARQLSGWLPHASQCRYGSH